MVKGKPQSRKDFEAAIIARAWKEPDFRKRLLADPKGALEEELSKLYDGAALPEGMKVYAHEEGPNDVHLVLPRNPQELTEHDLSEEDLDSVAGGTGIGVVVNTITSTIQNVQQIVVLDMINAVCTQQMLNVNIATNLNTNVVANVATTSVR